MSPFHRVVIFGILLVALLSGTWFIHNGGSAGFHLVPGFDGITEELAFRGVACDAHAAWSNDLHGECHHQTAVRR